MVASIIEVQNLSQVHAAEIGYNDNNGLAKLKPTIKVNVSDYQVSKINSLS